MELISSAKQNILALRSEVVFGEIADAAGFPADAELTAQALEECPVSPL